MAVRKKYKGNTLPEILIALSITSFCSTLAVIIYLNIQKSTMPFIRIKCLEIANRFLKEAISKKDYFDNTYQTDEYTVKKNIQKSEKYYDCMNLNIRVFDVNQIKICELQTTIHAE